MYVASFVLSRDIKQASNYTKPNLSDLDLIIKSIQIEPLAR